MLCFSYKMIGFFPVTHLFNFDYWKFGVSKFLIEIEDYSFLNLKPLQLERISHNMKEISGGNSLPPFSKGEESSNILIDGGKNRPFNPQGFKSIPKVDGINPRNLADGVRGKKVEFTLRGIKVKLSGPRGLHSLKDFKLEISQNTGDGENTFFESIPTEVMKESVKKSCKCNDCDCNAE